MAISAEFPFVRSLTIVLNDGTILEADAYAVKSLDISQIMPPINLKQHPIGSVVSLDSLNTDGERMKIQVTIMFEGESIKWGMVSAPEELLAGANFMLGEGDDS